VAFRAGTGIREDHADRIRHFWIKIFADQIGIEKKNNVIGPVIGPDWIGIAQILTLFEKNA
jgi:hypothetical protein